MIGRARSARANQMRPSWHGPIRFECSQKARGHPACYDFISIISSLYHHNYIVTNPLPAVSEFCSRAFVCVCRCVYVRAHVCVFVCVTSPTLCMYMRHFALPHTAYVCVSSPTLCMCVHECVSVPPHCTCMFVTSPALYVYACACTCMCIRSLTL